MKSDRDSHEDFWDDSKTQHVLKPHLPRSEMDLLVTKESDDDVGEYQVSPARERSHGSVMNGDEMHRCYAKNEDRMCANDEVNVNVAEVQYDFRIADEVDNYCDDCEHVNDRVDQQNDEDLDHEIEGDLNNDIADDCRGRDEDDQRVFHED